MQRWLLGAALILGLGSMTLVTVAFAQPTGRVVEPSNAQLNLGHETMYDSFAPVHEPGYGLFVMRHESWTMSVYLDRDPTSGCLLEWIRAGEVGDALGDGSLRYRAPHGAFYDRALGTVYNPDGVPIAGPGERRLSEVPHTMPHNTVQVIESEVRKAEPLSHGQRVCWD